jgi:hypothetical protein
MYGKWPACKQTRWWVAVVGILPMDQPEAFLKFIEAQHPVIAMLASEGAIADVGNGDRGRSIGNQWKDQQKKKEYSAKVTVNAAPEAAAAAHMRQQAFQLTGPVC